MALRVLLADESSTIKKVMQVALEEFGVDVKSVPVGLDVVQTSLEFKPDIIFADILLSKKNGYEVCQLLKSNSQLSSVPVVLMWSGFMDLDHQKFTESKANSSLEKPFDSETLKTLVTSLVPKLSGNQITPFLQFNERPDFTQDWDEEFRSVSLKQIAENKAPSQISGETTNPEIALKESNSKINWEPPAEIDLTTTNVLLSTSQEEVSLENFNNFNNSSLNSSANFTKKSQAPAIDPLRMEEILRSEAREVLEKIAWNLLPDAIDRIVKEEVQKILKEAEKVNL